MQAKHLHQILNSKALSPAIVMKMSKGVQNAALCLHDEADIFFRGRVSDNTPVPDKIVRYYNEFVRQFPSGLRKLLPQNIPVPTSVV